MNSKLDQIGTALGNAKVELNNLIVEFQNNKPILTGDEYDAALFDIAAKAIEIHNLDDKWADAEYAEFVSDPDANNQALEEWKNDQSDKEDDTHYFDDEDEYKYENVLDDHKHEDIRDEDLNDMDR